MRPTSTDDVSTPLFDDVPLHTLAETYGTPLYVYSLPRVLGHLARLQQAFAPLRAHVHYSAKANANLALLRALVRAGAGIDAVSLGEILRARHAGAAPQDIVFAGVGKTPEELREALVLGVGWFNVENEGELALLDAFAATQGTRAQVALRYNPDVAANTHPYIATGHGSAKFGLNADVVAALLARQGDFPHVDVRGIHVHIGSQLGDVDATVRAVRLAVRLAAPHPTVRTLNIGGGFPVPYSNDAILPTFEDFARALAPLLAGYDVLLEPGRSLVADAGVLLTRVLYVKQHGDERFVIVDAGMNDLLRPALYQAAHRIVPVAHNLERGARMPVQVVGPICESADVLGRAVLLPPVQPGDLLAILDAGAYGAVMGSTYNQRLRPAEVMVDGPGQWRLARRRDTYEDLLRAEVEAGGAQA